MEQQLLEQFAAWSLAGLAAVAAWSLYRALWDPWYCCMIATADARLVRSWPLQQLAPGVHVSQHLVTSGRGRCCARHIQKYSRMVIVEYGDGELCLLNPCPLTEELRQGLARLGRVATVVVTNCFHYMYSGQYAEAYPTARLLAPSGLLRKRPGMRGVFHALPSAASGTLVPGVTYFRLPDFYEEHVIHVDAAQLLYVSDTLLAWDGTIPNPGRTHCCLLLACTRKLSLQTVRKSGTRRLLYSTYARQYRLGSNQSLAANLDMWQRICRMPIARIVTGHGVFDGCMAVSAHDIADLLRRIGAADRPLDVLGRLWFRLCVLQCAPRLFRDWACLYERVPGDAPGESKAERAEGPAVAPSAAGGGGAPSSATASVAMAPGGAGM